MARNKFGIPESLLDELRLRDRDCAYCRKALVYPWDRQWIMDSATIEHLNREGPFYWRVGLELKDIVICSSPCNSSRESKLLTDWFASQYCGERGINSETVSLAVREYLARTGSAAEL